MKKVLGYATVEVNVGCPNCGKSFDVLSGNNDDDNIVSDALYENTTKSCTDIGYQLSCPDCDLEFELDEIVY